MKKLLKLIGKYKIFLGFSVIFAAISVVLQLYVPVLFGDAIDEVVAAHQVNFDMMWYYLKQILIFIVISAFATWFMNLLNNRMTYRIVQDIRSQAIRHIQVLPLSYLDQLDKPRKVYIHINNTNPILNEASAECAKLQAHGVEVAFDGMQIEL